MAKPEINSEKNSAKEVQEAWEILASRLGRFGSESFPSSDPVDVLIPLSSDRTNHHAILDTVDQAMNSFLSRRERKECTTSIDLVEGGIRLTPGRPDVLSQLGQSTHRYLNEQACGL